MEGQSVGHQKLRKGWGMGRGRWRGVVRWGSGTVITTRVRHEGVVGTQTLSLHHSVASTIFPISRASPPPLLPSSLPPRPPPLPASAGPGSGARALIRHPDRVSSAGPTAWTLIASARQGLMILPVACFFFFLQKERRSFLCEEGEECQHKNKKKKEDLSRTF